MDSPALLALDAWPYKNRLSDIMRAPVLTAAPDEALPAAAERMRANGVSALIAVDRGGRAVGIVTERDILRVVAVGAPLSERRVGDIMSSPVVGLPPDAYAYRAIARIERLGHRHCPVLSSDGRPVGMVSARLLLRQRAAFALALGDAIEVAQTSSDLKSVYRQLPALARAVLAQGVSGSEVAAIVATVVRDMTAKAADLAVAAMRASGEGPPPAAWCLLVLGSAGRGETLLVPDQDNALIHDGEAERVGRWFTAFGGHINRLLDEAGIPLCKGGVMARTPEFCRDLQGWRDTIERWASVPAGEALLNVDIFWDFVPVAGDRALARVVRDHATAVARRARPLLRQLAAQIEELRPPLDMLGRFRTESGRVDLKRFGLFPVVAAARVVALATGNAATSTAQRLADAAAMARLDRVQADALRTVHAEFLAAILEQQLDDLAAARAPSTLVEVKRWSKSRRERMRDSLKTACDAHLQVRDVLTA